MNGHIWRPQNCRNLYGFTVRCPAHAGVTDNEMVDNLASGASKAPTNGTLKMGRTGILREVRDNLMRSEMTIEKMTQSRLLEWRFDNGTTGRDHRCRRIQHVHQCATETISISWEWLWLTDLVLSAIMSILDYNHNTFKNYLQ